MFILHFSLYKLNKYNSLPISAIYCCQEYCTNKKITFTIDNSRTGLDTSKNQCSAPAVTALKQLLTVLCLQFISTKELIKCIRVYNYH